MPTLPTPPYTNRQVKPIQWTWWQVHAGNWDSKMNHPHAAPSVKGKDREASRCLRSSSWVPPGRTVIGKLNFPAQGGRSLWNTVESRSEAGTDKGTLEICHTGLQHQDCATGIWGPPEAILTDQSRDHLNVNVKNSWIKLKCKCLNL